MGWVLSPALVTFKNQLNAAFPHRDTRSDGTIGDARHRAEAGGSDHNPDVDDIVCAFDGTHGPYWHLSIQDVTQLVHELVASGDPRIKYVIFQRRIWTPAKGWHDYTGVSPHLEHFHLSVTQAGKRNSHPWDLPSFGAVNSQLVQLTSDLIAQAAIHTPPPTTTPQEDDDDMAMYFRNVATGAEIRAGVTTYTLLNPVQAALEVRNGAQFTDCDADTFHTIISSRDQAVVNGERL